MSAAFMTPASGIGDDAYYLGSGEHRGSLRQEGSARVQACRLYDSASREEARYGKGACTAGAGEARALAGNEGARSGIPDRAPIRQTNYCGLAGVLLATCLFITSDGCDSANLRTTTNTSARFAPPPLREVKDRTGLLKIDSTAARCYKHDPSRLRTNLAGSSGANFVHVPLEENLAIRRKNCCHRGRYLRDFLLDRRAPSGSPRHPAQSRLPHGRSPKAKSRGIDPGGKVDVRHATEDMLRNREAAMFAVKDLEIEINFVVQQDVGSQSVVGPDQRGHKGKRAADAKDQTDADSRVRWKQDRRGNESKIEQPGGCRGSVSKTRRAYMRRIIPTNTQRITYTRFFMVPLALLPVAAMCDPAVYDVELQNSRVLITIDTHPWLVVHRARRFSMWSTRRPRTVVRSDMTTTSSGARQLLRT